MDSIREVIEGARYAPTVAKYKIYIIDEVHMLSKSAFNALLKTLEEPPQHTKFVFATTEIRKVPLTILSRTQRFDLKRLEVEALSEHLKDIASKEGFTVEAEALTMLARAGDGSVRDALSLLDQAIALSGEQKNIRANDVQAMLGLGDQRQIWELLQACLSANSAIALQIYHRILQAGGEPTQICLDLLQAVLALTKKQLQIDVPLHGLSDAEYANWFQAVTPAETHRLWQILSKGYTELAQAPQPQAAGEMLILRAIYAHVLTEQTAMAPRVATIEAVATTPTPNYPPQPPLLPPLPPANDAPVQFKNFDALVKWVGEQREGILYTHLHDHVRVMEFAPPKMTLALLPAAPAQLPRQLGLLLQNKLGQAWQIDVAAEEDAQKPTIKEVVDKKAADQFNQAAQDPLVLQALQAFPGAKMVAVTAAPMHNPGEELSHEL